MELLGTLKIPQGATTDDVLTSDTNGVASWQVAPSGSGIPATIVDVKGDLIAATAADTVARLAAGANGTRLIADSAEATGLKWSALGGAEVVTALGGVQGATTDLRQAMINLGLYTTGGASPLDLNGGAFVAATAALGTTPATSGVLRIPNASYLVARNAANDGNVNMWRVNAANYLDFGATIYRDDLAGYDWPKAWIALRRQITTVPTAGGRDTGISVMLSSRHSGTVAEGRQGILARVADHSSVTNKTIIGITNVATLATVTATAHGYATGDRITLYGVVHTFNAEVNGVWTIANATADTFDITVTGLSSGAYTSGGTATNRGLLYAIAAVVAPIVGRGGFTGTAINGDDIAGLIVQNDGTGKGTDAIYLGTGGLVGSAEWVTSITLDCDTSYGIRLNGEYTYSALDFSGGTMTSGTAIKMGAGHNIELDTATGTKIGTATTQKLAFFNATPIVRPSSTTDLKVALVNLGLITTGGATSLNLNGGLFVGAGATIQTTGASSSIIVNRTDGGAGVLGGAAAFAVFAFDNLQPFYLSSAPRADITAGTLNTGVYDLSISTAANNHRVGIGLHTTVPSAKLHVLASAAADPVVRIQGMAAQAGNLLELYNTTPSLLLSVTPAGVLTFAEASDVAVGTSTGTKIGTATTQKLAFFNSTPIVQPANTTDLRAALISLGLLATGGATPLDLNGGALTSPRLTILATAGDIGTPVAGEHWYNSTEKTHRFQNAAAAQSLVGLIYTRLTDDASATGGTAEIKFASQIALAAAGLTVGKVIRVRIRGSYTTDATASQTAVLNVKLGDATNATSGTTVATTRFALTQSITGGPWSLDVDIVIRSATTAWGGGHGVVGSTVAAPWTAVATVASNGGGVATVTTIPNISTAHTVHVTVTPNDTGQTLSIRTMTVEILG